MSGERKLSDADVGSIRALASEGVSAVDLATRFDVTRRHVDRLIRGEQRAAVVGDDADGPGIADAVARLLDGRILEPADEVRAATARAIAAKMDAASRSTAAAAAGALPRLAGELGELIDRLAHATREPDRIDLLRERRRERIAATRAEHGYSEEGWR